MKKYVLASLALITTVALSQPKNLVFEGAGVRGLAYAGVIMELENRQLVPGIERVGGTSAGAIAALMVSLGYNGGEIAAITSELKLQAFNDGRFFFIGGFSRLGRSYGWYRGKAIEKWIGRIIHEKTGNEEITFLELKRDSKFKDLYVTGTNLSAQKMVIFSAETYPTMKVRDAVRISMSIPLYFQAVRIDSAGQVLDVKKDHRGDVFVDGGLTGNFPLQMFDSIAMNGSRIPNPATVGLRIDTPVQIRSDHEKRGLAPHQIITLKNYVASVYSYIIENLNRSQLTEEDWQRTVSISCGAIGPKIRKLSKEEKSFLISSGKHSIALFLDGHH
jgi:NTE family protein